MGDRVRIGIIGCGTISPVYFQGCRAFDILDIVACADRHRRGSGQGQG